VNKEIINDIIEDVQTMSKTTKEIQNNREEVNKEYMTLRNTIAIIQRSISSLQSEVS
jgi:hypothetical protein